jgi:hypothetical protein
MNLREKQEQNLSNPYDIFKVLREMEDLIICCKPKLSNIVKKKWFGSVKRMDRKWLKPRRWRH